MPRYEFKTRVSAVNTYGFFSDEPLSEEEILWEIQKYTEIAEVVDVNGESEELERGSLREVGRR